MQHTPPFTHAAITQVVPHAADTLGGTGSGCKGEIVCSNERVCSNQTKSCSHTTKSCSRQTNKDLPFESVTARGQASRASVLCVLCLEGMSSTFTTSQHLLPPTVSLVFAPCTAAHRHCLTLPMCCVTQTLADHCRCSQELVCLESGGALES